MEILIHRRLLKDDNRGVGEPLNETQSISPYDWKDDEDIVHREPVRIGKGLVVRGTHTISLTTPAKAAREYRRLQDELYYSPVLGFSVGTSFGSDQDFRSGLAVKLPKNVAILTVEMQPSGSVLVLPLPLDSMPHSPFPLLLLFNRHHCLQMNRIGWKTSTLVLSLGSPGFWLGLQLRSRLTTLCLITNACSQLSSCTDACGPQVCHRGGCGAVGGCCTVPRHTVPVGTSRKADEC